MKQEFKFIGKIKSIIEDESHKRNMFEKEKFKELNSKEAREFIEENYGDYSEDYKKRIKDIADKYKYKYKVDYLADPVGRYVGGVNVYVNNRLRKCNYEAYVEGTANWEIDSTIDRLQEIILNAPRLQDDVVLYRAVDDAAIKKILEQMNNDIYRDSGFISTSLVQEKARGVCDLSNNMIKIYAEKGSVALGIDYINDRSELEILLPSNSSFLFLGEKEKLYEFMLINPNVEEPRNDRYEEHIKVMKASGYEYHNKELIDVINTYTASNSVGAEAYNEEAQKGCYVKAMQDRLNEILYSQKALDTEVTAHLEVNNDVISKIETKLSEGDDYRIEDKNIAFKNVCDIEESMNIIQIIFKKGMHIFVCTDVLGRERVLFPDEMYITKLKKQDDYYLAELKECHIVKR